MRKDPTEFRKRFAAWKNGEKVYKDGLPAYRGGKGSGKINYSRWDNAELTSYPVPFIDEKRITLTNAGRATGAVLSTNLLDSIADNADRAGLPLLTALGLAVKESTLGNPTDDKSAWNLSSGIRRAFNNKYPGTELHINYWGDALNEREDVINYHKGHLSDDPASGHKSVLLEAFEFYKQHPDKYNTGQKDYQTAVDKRGVEVMQSPEVKRWKNAYDTKRAVRQWTKPNLLLKESRFNKPAYKDGKLPGYKDGDKPITVGEYNVYPSAIGASELNVTTPEVVVTGKDRRPLYLRYAAEQSTFDPNTIRNFTDWLPVIGDIGSGIDFKNAIQNKDYITASTIGAGFILPPAAARILRNPIQKTIKYGKRFFNAPAYTYATRSGLSNGAVEFPEKYASRFADQTVTPTGPEKAMFSQMYSKGISRNLFMSSDLMNYSILDYINAGFTREQGSRIQQMFLRNPEYAKYIETKGLQNANPLSQTTVDDFLKLQFTSLRGVHAPDKESAMIYLTHGEKGRNMPGGDRLGTNGGVYTSNSTNVADRFKNPEFGTEDGWVGRVVYPYDIRRDIPIEDQLELYRKMVFPAGEVHPMYGTESYFRELQNARNGLSIAIESDYVGRASRGVPGQERAYLPIKKESHPILNVESVSYYPNQTNQNGRWGYGMNAGDTDGLFIPRQMNAYSDFIRSAKTFLSPRIKRDQIIYSDRYKQASDLWKAQARKRDSIVQKIENTNNKIKKAAGLTMLFSPVAAAGLGIYKKIKSDEEFYNSPEFELFLSDPNYEKYLNIDDGSFWKLGSFEKLEHKYKRKYLNRIGDK